MFLGSPWEPRPSGRSGACSAKVSMMPLAWGHTGAPLAQGMSKVAVPGRPSTKTNSGDQEISPHSPELTLCRKLLNLCLAGLKCHQRTWESNTYLPTTLIFTVFSLFFSAGQSKDSPSRIPNSLLWSHHPSDFIGEGAILADAPACSQNSKHLLCKWFSDSLPGCERCHNNDNYRMAIGSSELPKFHLTLVY